MVGREPTLALRVEEEVPEVIRKRWGSGGIDTSPEEGTGARHRGIRHLKHRRRAVAHLCAVEAPAAFGCGIDLPLLAPFTCFKRSSDPDVDEITPSEPGIYRGGSELPKSVASSEVS